MSRKENPCDNAFAESLIKIFKYDEVYSEDYNEFADAYMKLGDFIELVYNRKQLHSAIGHTPPDEFEGEVKSRCVFSLVVNY